MSRYTESNADERTADLESRATSDHDAAADRADEQNGARFGAACRSGSAFADTIFEFAKANAETSRASFQAGYEAGHHAGYCEAMREAKAMVKAGMQAEQETLL